MANGLSCVIGVVCAVNEDLCTSISSLVIVVGLVVQREERTDGGTFLTNKYIKNIIRLITHYGRKKHYQYKHQLLPIMVNFCPFTLTNLTYATGQRDHLS